MPDHDHDSGAFEARLSRLADRLEGLIAFEQERLLRPARLLVAEVDGEEVASFAPDTHPQLVRGEDFEATLTLRDEFGTSRVEVSVEEGSFDPISVDGGRLVVALEVHADHWRLSVTSARSAPERLAAASAHEDDPAIIPFGLTTLGYPEVDGDGWFSMEGFCDPRLAGETVQIEVGGVGSFATTVERGGALRVLARAPAGVPPGEVGARRVRARRG